MPSDTSTRNSAVSLPGLGDCHVSQLGAGHQASSQSLALGFLICKMFGLEWFSLRFSPALSVPKVYKSSEIGIRVPVLL